MTLMINPFHTWNAIDIARSNRCHCPTSPNTAPATKNDSHDQPSQHMKRYWQCAEQQVSLSNLTKYCACHEKSPSSLNRVTYETLFTMRGATAVIDQPHQIVRLPRKVTLIIEPRHIWNAIYNARSNSCHCPTSPTTAPATQNDNPKYERNLMKTDETSFTMRDRSETVPTMIREWSENETVSPQPAAQPKIQHFALRLSFQISPNTAPATKSDTSTSPNTAPATKSDSSTSPNAAPGTKSATSTSPNTASATKSKTWTSPNFAPATKSDWTMLLLDDANTLGCYYFRMLLLYDAITWRCYYLTMLLLDEAITWQCYYVTMLYYLTMLILYDAIT